MKKAVSIIAAGIALATPAVLISAPKLSETRSALNEWVELKKLISQEKNEWKVEKQTLDESIGLLEKEIKGLQERIEAQVNDASRADEQRIELTDQENELKEATAVIKLVISDLEEQVLGLLAYFPESLKSKLKILTERIPKDEKAAKKLDLVQRTQTILGILGEVEKFNSQITLENSMQEIEGQNVEVQALYIGLAIAYYVDGTKTEAGILRPSAKGWVKEQRNELAEEIASAVAHLEREEQARFVGLPMDVQ